MKLSSPDFEHNGKIPAKFTCDGADINPALVIEDIPEQAAALALIVNDPDAPAGDWTHWVVYDIPVGSRIEQNSVPGKQGMNDFKKTDYGGPCPPSGTHRYFFKAYALDSELGLEQGKSRAEVEQAMTDHVLDSAELIGLYSRS